MISLYLLSAVDISIIFPTNNFFSKINTLNINYTRGSDSQACWYSNDTYIINTTLVNCVNITDVTWSEGVHNISIWTNDSAGNTNVSYLTFTIDTLFPNINFTFPTPTNVSIHHFNSVYVNVSTNDTNEHSAWIDWGRTLKGWWNFEWINSTNGAIYDNSSYNRVSSLVGATFNVTVPGKRGQGLDFNGSTSYVNLGSPLFYPSEWTYSAWFYPRSNGTSISALVGQGNNPALRWGGALNRVYLFLGCLNCSPSYRQIGSSDLTLNQWHYAVGVVNLSTDYNQSETLYIDGVRVSSTSWNSSTLNSTGEGAIVKPSTTHFLNIRDSARSFNGTIDEVMIFSRALTPEEINASYNAGLYKLFRNFTDLPETTYSYKAYAIDSAGNVNSTEEETLVLSTAFPDINFTFPTPANASFQQIDVVPINISTYDANDHSVFIDWNRSLIGWWNFENISSNGTVYDGSTYGYTGRLYNSSNLTVLGKRGQALAMENDYIDTADIDLTTQFTISAWFRINESKTGSNVHTIVSKWEDSSGQKVNYHLDIRLGKLRASISNISGTQGSAPVSGNTTINVGQWYHGAATFKGGILKLYVNGTLDNQTDTHFISLYTGTVKTRIGAFTFPWSLYQDEFNGTLDEVMIFSRALSADEIKSLYNAKTYQFYNNITELQDGDYTYKAYAIDEAGYINSTEERTTSINSTSLINCTNLDIAGKSYVLESDLVNDQIISFSCINISKADILLDCQGYSISSIQNVSGIYSSQRNTTIKNCNINFGGGNKTNVSAKGIYFNYTGQYGHIFNNTVNATYGIYLDYYSSNNLLSNNTVIGGTLSGVSAIYLRIASYNNLTSNILKTANGYACMIEQSSNNNILINNTATSNTAPGIRIGLSYYNSLINNTAISTSSAGIYLLSSKNNTLVNNVGLSDISYAFRLDSSSNNTFINNTGINDIGPFGAGILITSIATYPVSMTNLFINNTMTSNSSYAVYIGNTSGNIFYNQIAVGYLSGSQGVHFNYYAINNTFQDCINISGVLWDVNSTVNSVNNTFINCSYDSSKEFVGSDSRLIRKGYYSASTNDTDGNPVIAEINATDSNNGLEFSVDTDSSGSINITPITDYVNLGGTKTYSSPYNITASNSSYPWIVSHSFNASNGNNLTDIFVFIVDPIAPDINFTFPTPSNASFKPTNSVYVNVSTYDLKDHSAFIDWNRSLIGWWAMDFYNSSGIYDNSSYNNFAGFFGGGLSSGNITYGKRGNALEFDGIDDYIETRDNSILNITGDFSVFAWIKAKPDNDNYNVIVGQYNIPAANSYGYLLYLTTGLIRASIYSGENGFSPYVTGLHDLRDNQWHHVGFTFNSSVIKIYEDEIVVNSADWTYPPVMLSNRVTIGIRRPNNADLPFNGSIDEVMIFNRELTSQEINASYNAGLYKLFRNFTDLPETTYSYKAYTIDVGGNVNTTEERTVTVDSVFPDINFTFPTLANDSSQRANSVYINVSTSDVNNYSAFIDWNKSLVSWLAMDFYNSSGIYDNSSYNNFGSFNGGLSISRVISANRGNGLEFDGKGDYLEIGNESNFDFTSNFTVEAWIKPRGNDAYNAVIGKYLVSPISGWDWILQGGYIRMTARGTSSIDTGGQGNYDLRDGNWHHIVAVVTKSYIQQYIDGAPYTSATGNWTPTTNNVTLKIGRRDTGLTDFNGSIDEVKIFNRVLNLEEIRASYTAGTYKLYHNFTNLPDAGYTYKAYAIDSAGNVNTTEERTITVDSVFPDINFTFPTPSNASTQSANSVFVNVSTYDANDHSVFIDWNRSLIGWWNFENVSSNGTVYDSSTYGYNGRMVGFTLNTTVSGKRGNALVFDGLDDYVNFNYNQIFNITNKITVEGWFYHASDAYYSPIISRDDAIRRSWTVRTINYDNISFSVWNGASAVTAAKLITNPVNSWHHFAAVCNSTAVIIYVDGVSGVPVDFSGDIIDTNMPLNIGRGAGSYPYWNGSIDEVKIYNRILSPTEINASYNTGFYKLYNNFTNLSDATYPYKAYAIDSAGNVNTTGERTVTIQQPSAPSAETPSEGGGGAEGCTYDWVCSEWYPEPCTQEGIQKRICVNRGGCNGVLGMPTLNRTCTPEVFEPAEPLFDIFVNIPLQSKWILKGDNASFDVRLINVGNKTTIDVSFQYLVIDSNNSLIVEKRETRAVGERDEFGIELSLPANLKEGHYRVYVQIDYDEGRVATAGDSFEIVKDNYTLILRRIVSSLPAISISIIVLLILIKLLSLIRKNSSRKYDKEKKKRSKEAKRIEKRERKIKKKKRKEYARRYKKKKRQIEREIKEKRVRHKRKIKQIKQKEKKPEKIGITAESISPRYRMERKKIEARQRRRLISDIRKKKLEK